MIAAALVVEWRRVLALPGTFLIGAAIWGMVHLAQRARSMRGQR